MSAGYSKAWVESAILVEVVDLEFQLDLEASLVDSNSKVELFVTCLEEAQYLLSLAVSFEFSTDIWNVKDNMGSTEIDLRVLFRDAGFAESNVLNVLQVHDVDVVKVDLVQGLVNHFDYQVLGRLNGLLFNTKAKPCLNSSYREQVGAEQEK